MKFTLITKKNAFLIITAVIMQIVILSAAMANEGKVLIKAPGSYELSADEDIVNFRSMINECFEPDMKPDEINMDDVFGIVNNIINQAQPGDIPVIDCETIKNSYFGTK